MTKEPYSQLYSLQYRRLATSARLRRLRQKAADCEKEKGLARLRGVELMYNPSGESGTREFKHEIVSLDTSRDRISIYEGAKAF